jgi:hypothetical protein
MTAAKQISINVTDLSSINDSTLAILLAPVTKSREIVNVDPKHIDGMAVVLECDRKRALAIIEVIRMKYGKKALRAYENKKQI